ncbi:MAG: flagellar biosynthesis protein FlhA [bacterium]|nr:flagellar biosynthesis protein FlhA [bacterium]
MEEGVLMIQRDQIMLAVGALGILCLLVVPLPGPLLDFLLSLSISVSLLVLLLALFAERPLEFSVFPTLLLILTLMRLGLNVGTTRLILMNGNEGTAAAGRLIEAFGAFTVGGSYIVGIVIFLLFVIINMMVITKGSGRIAEVAARFTLDAMPGKQMAIDADLSQGVIDDAEALQRRETVQREADFYGAMDGASKFVKGDATAGIVIMLINVVGGLAIGMFQHNMAVGEAAETYTILTVGDGLVSQIPSLIVSTAAGMIVSRAGESAPLASELRGQVFGRVNAMGITAGMLGAIALAPGLPFVPFALLSAGAFALSRSMAAEGALQAEEEPEAPAAQSEEEQIAGALALDDLELEIGYGLIPLVDPDKQGELLARIRATRRQLATELGFVVPLIHIRDNLQLEPGGYEILIKGNSVACGEIPPSHALAISPGDGAEEIPGVATVDPAFGLPAKWVRERDMDRASTAGYAVVDASTALATHLAEVIRTYAVELLSRRRVRELLDQFAESAPNVVEEIVPTIVSLSLLHRTMRSLLAERVSIRDIGTVLDTLAEYAPKIQDPDLLTDLVRERLGRAITRPYLDDEGSLRVITLSPELEEKLRNGVQRTESGSFLAVDPQTIDSVVKGVEGAVRNGDYQAGGRVPVLLAAQTVRSSLYQLISRVVPRLAVLSHSELPAGVQIVAEEVVREGDAR